MGTPECPGPPEATLDGSGTLGIMPDGWWPSEGTFEGWGTSADGAAEGPPEGKGLPVGILGAPGCPEATSVGWGAPDGSVAPDGSGASDGPWDGTGCLDEKLDGCGIPVKTSEG